MLKRICFMMCLILCVFLQPAMAEEYDSLKQKCRNQQGNLNSEQNLSVCHTCLVIRPNDGDIFGYIASWYLQSKQLDNADSWLKKGFAVDDKNATLYLIRGYYNKQKGMVDSAINDIKKAISIKPEYFNALFALAEIYKENEEFETASTYYKRAVELNPDSALYNIKLAFCYEQTTNPARAHEYYEKVISLKPQSKDILYLTYSGLGNSYYYDIKEYDKAVVNYKKSYDIKKTETTCTRIALSYQKLKDYTSELKWRNEAIKLNASKSSHYNERGIVYGKLEKKDEAILDYKKAIELNPSDPHAYYNIAIIYDDDKETIPDAIKYYELAFDRFDDEKWKATVKENIEYLTTPNPVDLAVKYDLPTDHEGFNRFLENYGQEIDNARYYFRGNEPEKAYEILNTIEEKHLKLKKFHSEWNDFKYNGKSRSSLEYYLKQISIAEKIKWYENVQEEYRLRIENERKNKEKAPSEIAERYKDTKAPSNYKYILKTLKNFKNWKVVTDFRKFFDSPYISLGEKTGDIVFYDLPIDASAFEDQVLIKYAKISRKINNHFLITNTNGKEALANISKATISKVNLQYNEYYYLVCQLADVVSVDTVGGSQKPVALVNVTGIIKEEDYKSFARYVAGHPDKFPYTKYLIIENIN